MQDALTPGALEEISVPRAGDFGISGCLASECPRNKIQTDPHHPAHYLEHPVFLDSETWHIRAVRHIGLRVLRRDTSLTATNRNPKP